MANTLSGNLRRMDKRPFNLQDQSAPPHSGTTQLVREYLGEAYVTQGKLDLAKAELAEIEKRCGTTCEPYEDLAEAIEHAES